eukprot:369621_1
MLTNLFITRNDECSSRNQRLLTLQFQKIQQFSKKIWTQRYMTIKQIRSECTLLTFEIQKERDCLTGILSRMQNAENTTDRCTDLLNFMELRANKDPLIYPSLNIPYRHYINQIQPMNLQYLPKTTKIRLSNKTSINIQNIKVGHSLLSLFIYCKTRILPQPTKRPNSKHKIDKYGKQSSQFLPSPLSPSMSNKPNYSGTLKLVKVTKIYKKRTSTQLIQIVTTNNFTITCSSTQLFWLSGKGWGCFDVATQQYMQNQKILHISNKIYQLEIGESLLSVSGNRHQIIQINCIENKNRIMYSICVSDNDNFFANDCLVYNHDCDICVNSNTIGYSIKELLWNIDQECKDLVFGFCREFELELNISSYIVNFIIAYAFSSHDQSYI